MSWFFAVFFGVIALCVVLYLGARLRENLAPRVECEAVVEKRYTENFPLTMGFVRRDRQEKHLSFRPEGESALDFPVNDDLYKLCPAGTKGVLIYQGKRLLRFDVTAFPFEMIVNELKAMTYDEFVKSSDGASSGYDGYVAYLDTYIRANVEEGFVEMALDDLYAATEAQAIAEEFPFEMFIGAHGAMSYAQWQAAND